MCLPCIRGTRWSVHQSDLRSEVDHLFDERKQAGHCPDTFERGKQAQADGRSAAVHSRRQKESPCGRGRQSFDASKKNSAQRLLVNEAQIQEDLWALPLVEEEGRKVICQALHDGVEVAGCGEMHNKMKEVSMCIGVKTGGQRTAGLGMLAWRRRRELLFGKRKK